MAPSAIAAASKTKCPHDQSPNGHITHAKRAPPPRLVAVVLIGGCQSGCQAVQLHDHDSFFDDQHHREGQHQQKKEEKKEEEISQLLLEEDHEVFEASHGV